VIPRARHSARRRCASATSESRSAGVSAPARVLVVIGTRPEGIKLARVVTGGAAGAR